MTLKPRSSSRILYALLITLLSSCGLKHEWTFKGHSVKGVHSRGVHVLDSTIAISGVRGIYSTYDLEGNQLSLDSIPDVADFRDVMQFDNGSMALMEGSNNSSLVYIDENGKSKLVYRRSAAFIDGFDFWDQENGYAYGDPFNKRFYLLKTENSGQKWKTMSTAEIDKPIIKEAGFAASGTGVQCLGDSTVVFGTGGIPNPRFFVSTDRGESFKTLETPMKGGETSGIYSLYFWNEQEGIIIGGDYKNPESRDSVCYKTIDQGKTWIDASKGLGGYCSTVQGRKDGALLIASGRVGTYYSLDQGKKWKMLTDEKYYACYVTDTHVVFSGKSGTFAIMTYEL